MSGGAFMVSRQIWHHPEFKPDSFSEREAFIWLISEAAWTHRTVRAGRVVVDLKRGQLCASLRFISTAWGWSKSRVDRFLKRIENRDMIRTQTETGQLVISVCNYDKYQGERDTIGTRAKRKAGRERDTSGTNDNKGNKDNKDNNPPTPQGDDGFDAFWAEVPRKAGKGQALKAYRAALKKADAEIILQGMIDYAASVQGKDAQYIAHPATWLNGERWQDELPPPQSEKTWRDKPESEWTAKDRADHLRWML